MAATTQAPASYGEKVKVWLTVKSLANRFDTHPSTIYRWAQQGRFPKPVKLGENLTRWALSDVEAWEQSQREAC
ncbi:helix-turn-helix transcriptional regulator [Vreelandella nigrificans]|uniref:AlpA family transcriptional regulator n=1 Tax=Vreelandella nigrificans TaxID=2042704 RepID=A0A2A4HIP5_9GAMM|nr:AlpA family phage regulatory protein [Halomonas nigrificans]PCF95278.1 AlpA family transcriptional regulator [Halomonas nigrificans]